MPKTTDPLPPSGDMENSQTLFARANEAAGRKDKPTARKLLDELIFFEPGNEEAWLLLSKVVDDLNEVSDCLQHVLAINPNNQAARQKYDDLLRRHPNLAELDPAKAADYAKAKAAKKAEVRAAKKAEKAEAKAAKKAEEAKKKAEAAGKTATAKRK
jgi:hypothetical protein